METKLKQKLKDETEEEEKTDDEKVIDKLKEPDVLIYIGKCYSADMGLNAIAKAIKRRFGIDATYHQIRKVVAIFKNRQSDLIKGDRDLQGMIKGVIIDTESEIRRLHKECVSILEEAKYIQNFNARISAIRELRSLIELQDKLLSKLHGTLDGSKVNKLELTQIIVNSLDDLEKQGIIKILKNPNNPLESIGIDSNKIIEEEVENAD